MATYPLIPLGIRSPQLPSPQEALTLAEMTRQMREQNQVRALGSMPGMMEGGLWSQKGLSYLSQISPGIASQAAQQRSAVLAQQALEDERKNKAAELLGNRRTDYLDQGMSGAVQAYIDTKGSRQNKMAALQKYLADYAKNAKDSGKAAEFGLTDEMLSAYTAHKDVQDIIGKLGGPNHSKESVEAANRLRRALAEHEVDQEGAPQVSLSDLGKPDIFEHREVVPGLGVQGPGAQQEVPLPGLPPTETRIGPQPETTKVAGGETGGKRIEFPSDVTKEEAREPTDYRAQADRKDRVGDRLSKMGDTAGAEKAYTEADRLRRRAEAADRIDQAEERIRDARNRAIQMNIPLPPDVAKVIGIGMANGNLQLGTGLARNREAKNQVLTEMVRALDNKGLSEEEKALHINAAHAAFSGGMQTQRTLGVRAAQMEIPAEELKEFIPLAENAISKVPRTSFVPWNRLVQLYDTNRADPAQRQLYIATQTVINAYSQIVARGGISVHAQERSEALINAADSEQSYKAALRFMWQEAEKGRAAIARAQKSSLGRMLGEPFKEEQYPGGPEKKQSAPMFSDPEKQKRFEEYKRTHGGQ